MKKDILDKIQEMEALFHADLVKSGHEDIVLSDDAVSDLSESVRRDAALVLHTLTLLKTSIESYNAVDEGDAASVSVAHKEGQMGDFDNISDDVFGEIDGIVDDLTDVYQLDIDDLSWAIGSLGVRPGYVESHALEKINTDIRSLWDLSSRWASAAYSRVSHEIRAVKEHKSPTQPNLTDSEKIVLAGKFQEVMQPVRDFAERMGRIEKICEQAIPGVGPAPGSRLN